jgi:hypothetical protein
MRADGLVIEYIFGGFDIPCNTSKDLELKVDDALSALSYRFSAPEELRISQKSPGKIAGNKTLQVRQAIKQTIDAKAQKSAAEDKSEQNPISNSINSRLTSKVLQKTKSSSTSSSSTSSSSSSSPFSASSSSSSEKKADSVEKKHHDFEEWLARENYELMTRNYQRFMEGYINGPMQTALKAPKYSYVQEKRGKQFGWGDEVISYKERTEFVRKMQMNALIGGSHNYIEPQQKELYEHWKTINKFNMLLSFALYDWAGSGR